VQSRHDALLEIAVHYRIPAKAMVYAQGLFLSFHEVPDDLLEEYGENAVQSAHENERYEGVRRTRGHHDAHPDRRDQYGNQGGRPGIPSQGIVKAGDAQERPHEA
jgi:hypothetical protein